MADKIAIVGGGIAGLTAAYLLNEKHDITLFEKEDRLGGNMYTLDTRDGDRFDVSVFFFNQKTYVNFMKLLEKVGLPVKARRLAGASMTMIDMDSKETIYFNLDPMEKMGLERLSVKAPLIMLRMVVNIVKGLHMYRAGEFEGMTMEESLKKIPGLKGYSSKMMLFPLCLMASMYYHELMMAPAGHFWGKVDTHFGTFFKAAAWGLIEHRTDDYIDALAKNYRDKIVLNSDIESVGRSGGKVTLKMGDGSTQVFDKIVFACYADQALKMLENPTDDEKRILGAWKYNDGLVVVHKDVAQFPTKELMSMYEYIHTERNGRIDTSINASYAFQKKVARSCEYMGTQYPNFPIKKELTEFQKVFRTPIYDANSVKAIKELPRLNGTMNSYYCGSHFGFGLHEDAIASAIEAARKLGAEWE